MARIATVGEEDARVLQATWEGGDIELLRRAYPHGKRILANRGMENVQRNASELVQRWVSDYATGRVGNPYDIASLSAASGGLDLRMAAAPAPQHTILVGLAGEELEGASATSQWRPGSRRTGGRHPRPTRTARLGHPGLATSPHGGRRTARDGSLPMLGHAERTRARSQG